MAAAVACLDEVCEAIDRIVGREQRMLAMRSAGCSRVAVRRENAIAAVRGVEGVRNEKVVVEKVSTLHGRDGRSFVQVQAGPASSAAKLPWISPHFGLTKRLASLVTPS